MYILFLITQALHNILKCALFSCLNATKRKDFILERGFLMCSFILLHTSITYFQTAMKYHKFKFIWQPHLNHVISYPWKF